MISVIERMKNELPARADETMRLKKKKKEKFRSIPRQVT